MRIRTAFKLIVAAVVLALALGAVAIWRFDAVRWRAQVFALVASGSVPDLSTLDAAKMLMPGSGYWLQDVIDTRSAYATISNPYTAAADAASGKQTFLSYCAGCHGADARGGTGPSLVARRLTHGNSDWAVFRTVRYGVPGTSMAAHPWNYRRIWQVIAYVHSLDASHEPGTPDESASARTAHVEVPYEELRATREPGADWLTYSGSYSGTRHSSLAQIDRDNVSRLAPLWVHQFSRQGDRIQMTPIVRDGVMYVTYAGSVMALDARDGTLIWRFDRSLPPDALSCCGHTNRGVAILGDRLFVGTIDSKLVALSAKTGRKLWETAVAPDYASGISITGAPLAFGDLVLTGVGGGDYPNRGFIAAFDAATGKERWRFYTIPGPNAPGHETWPQGDAWRTGGGATWLTGSYDPQHDVVYWGTGNPAPNHNAASRRGDNLYTDSVVALQGATGKLLWYFQFTPGDVHDWDSVQTPILVDRPGTDVPHRLLWANRNGFFYALNRDNGGFLYGAPYIYQTWAQGLDPHGHPIVLPHTAPSAGGTLIYPGVQGGTNWWSPSYDPDLDLVFVPSLHLAGVYFSNDHSTPERRQLFLSGYPEAAPDVPHHQQIVAIRGSDAKVAWTHAGRDSLSDDLHFGGLVSTAGGLVFASDDATFYAVDSRDGRLLWSFPTGGRIGASPMTFLIDGKQVVAVASGRALLAFALVGAPPGDAGAKPRTVARTTGKHP